MTKFYTQRQPTQSNDFLDCFDPKEKRLKKHQKTTQPIP